MPRLASRCHDKQYQPSVVSYMPATYAGFYCVEVVRRDPAMSIASRRPRWNLRSGVHVLKIGCVSLIVFAICDNASYGTMAVNQYREGKYGEAGGDHF